jgi:hypothetical protein
MLNVPKVVPKHLKDIATHIIYIDVLGYSTKIWNPALAVHLHNNCYQVLESPSDSSPEVWQFKDGDIVRCENYEFAEGEIGLIAVAKCNCGSNF